MADATNYKRQQEDASGPHGQVLLSHCSPDSGWGTDPPEPTGRCTSCTRV
jgi:hypothetical protein